MLGLLKWSKGFIWGLAHLNCAEEFGAQIYQLAVTDLTLEPEAMYFYQHDPTNQLIGWPQIVGLGATICFVTKLVILQVSGLSKCPGKGLLWKFFLHHTPVGSILICLTKATDRLISDGIEDLMSLIGRKSLLTSWVAPPSLGNVCHCFNGSWGSVLSILEENFCFPHMNCPLQSSEQPMD